MVLSFAPMSVTPFEERVARKFPSGIGMLDKVEVGAVTGQFCIPGATFGLAVVRLA